ncbi:MAG: Asp-tRNA(Asn)/Glu-tRNA(Gln) amidotransferase subunit GatA [Gammaproteobacteria bacterium]|nr:Asp-tRNA(Asn)/Glu-tRNA(Gln) amidotransferase subunit GatA [Gammaproteobacteria bacterium]
MSTTELSSLARSLSGGAFSSVELTQSYLDRIAAAPELNTFITVDEAFSLAQARASDERRRRGEVLSPLDGIPIAHKDIFCTRGMLTTCGSHILDGFVSPYDATVIERFGNGGAVTLGKTNMDEFAMGSSGETSYYGVIRNPWDTSRVPGGSSAGSAAALAAGLCPAATGTDTGGSIRQPAAFCGVTGFKPSYGQVSRYGMIAFASSLDQGGPLARSARDAALMMDVMAGFDSRDATSVPQDQPDFSGALDNDLKGLRIGVPAEFFGAGLDEPIERAVRDALRVFEEMGAQIKEVSLPNSELCVPCYYVIAPSEASSNLSRFDGVRFGHRAKEYDDLVGMYMKTRAEGFGAEVKRRVMIGTFALSAGYYDAYYNKALKLRRLIAEDFDRAFAECDVLMGPTTPTTAFPIGDKTDDPIAMYLNDIFTIPVNLAGLPGLSMPAGLDPAGLPIGLQVIGRYFDDARVLNVAHQYQRRTEWHTRWPEGWPS